MLASVSGFARKKRNAAQDDFVSPSLRKGENRFSTPMKANTQHDEGHRITPAYFAISKQPREFARSVVHRVHIQRLVQPAHCGG
jgi:hypothetical protein